MKVLLQTGPYRFIQKGILAINGKPDYRLQRKNDYNGLWYEVCLFDNSIQCSYAMEDIEYTKLLAGDPAYQKKQE